MLLLSNAKINLGLHVGQRRPDGFHSIETVFFPIGWSDLLEALPHPNALTLRCTGLCACAEQEKNLCARAFRLLQRDFGLPGADIFLHKQIPVGAGLGGGSGNAAFTLRMLSELFRLALSPAQLAAYAAQLGSDCAFFVYNTPMLATGRGEVLQPVALSLSGYELLVVKPALSVSTAEAYASIAPHPAPRAALSAVVSQPVACWKHTLINDFEEGIFAKYPLLKDIKAELYGAGACYAAMSGSGSALFGIFSAIPSGLAEAFSREGCATFRQSFTPAG
ncbi:MAG: 4-(cytidine 5'-diphospho)-2-C-methyl-D-erythritol kinase [Prevotellaceae bacterium]|jgi:4-diphosphocytidyl-2-C-methyl-D-erythritol kinase|nr:4-(cytidine 5'-diphospho)-2-C-methyl-D-erythritol kinase [Prevotellaceae bacterium]